MTETMFAKLSAAIEAKVRPSMPIHGWDSDEIARAALEAIREPDAAMVRAASESDADDGEGGTFGPLFDLLDFSGENKTRLVVAEALRKAVDAILSQSQEGVKP